MISFGYARRRNHLIKDKNPFKLGYVLEGDCYIQVTPKMELGTKVRVIGYKEGWMGHAFTIGDIVECCEIATDDNHRFRCPCNEDVLHIDEYEFV